MEKPKIYSERVRGFGRTYFFDILTTEKGRPYLSLTASRKDKEKEGEYQTDRFVVFMDDVDLFQAAMGRAIQNFHEHRLNGA